MAPATASRAGRGAALSPGDLAHEISGRIAALGPAGVAQIRRVRREFSGRIRSLPAGDVLRLAHALRKIPGASHGFVAYELVRGHPLAPSRVDAPALRRLARGMASWDAVDCFSIILAGPAWSRGRLADAVIHAWARSPDRWWRRAALVSTVPLNSRAHGGTGDPGRTLRVCRMLEGDRDPMVVKALSWALRELAKRDPEAVRSFLSERAGRLPALVLRECRNKLETGLKNPRRRRA